MKASQRYDVIVAGVGSMGSAACYHLARRGLRVLGLERQQLVHEFGSHHGRARMIRQAYFEHPDYVPLLQRAFHNWDELEAASGQRSLHRTGGLYIGAPDGAIVSGSLLAAEQHRLRHERLDHRALGERFPSFQLPSHMEGFFDPEGGYLVPEIAVASHIDQARQHGAELHAHEAIRDWTVENHGEASATVVVHTDRGRYRAGQLVLTAGAWTSPLLHELPVDLQVTRQIQAWFRPPQASPFREQADGFPCWFVETQPPCGHYGFPLSEPADTESAVTAGAMKVALHQAGNAADPDHLDRQVTSAETDAITDFLLAYLPAAAGPLVDASVCLYTNSRDGHFIVDRHPDYPRQVSLACGFSGHGFKFASVIGEALADLACEGRSDLPIDFLGLDRLR